MIKIDAESDAYKELIAIFSSSLKDYNPKNYIDIVEMKDCRKKCLCLIGNGRDSKITFIEY